MSTNGPFDLPRVTSSFVERFTRTLAPTTSFVQRGSLYSRTERKKSSYLSLFLRRRKQNARATVPTTRSHDFHKPLLPCSLPNRGRRRAKGEKGEKPGERRRELKR